MPVEQAHIIDAIAFDERAGEIALIMTETRAWTGTERHLFELQEKVNAYLSFALDGEMAENFPQFAGRPMRLQLECTEPPDTASLQMIAAMREQIAFQGIRFEIRTVAAQSCGTGCTCEQPRD